MTEPNPTNKSVISADALLAAGYKEYPPGIERCVRLLQKAISDESGRIYFITFREWEHEGKLTYDANMAFDTHSDGYVWATIREDMIATVETRAEAIWKAAGGTHYDNQ